MRAGMGLVCLLLCVTTAGADPALRPKRANATYQATALEYFLKGLAYQQSGDLYFAFNAYETSMHYDKKQAATYFNVALMSLAVERTDDAARLFKSYLQYAPKDASDRAQIEALIKQLEAADPVLTIGGKVKDIDTEADAVVLVDGRLIGPSPGTTTVTEGSHDAERITASTYGQRTFTVRKGVHEYVEVNSSTTDGIGNVVISGLSKADWKDGATRFSIGKRFTLKPGRYATTPTRGGALTCTPIEFEVKPGKQLTYVRVIGEETRRSSCFTVKQVNVQRLDVGAK